jgi:molybdopterin molybdotransferase
MLELENARGRILAALPKPVGEHLPLSGARGRILSARISAPLDLPGFDNSAMDGYAVRESDVALASSASPVRLRIAGRIPAGQVFTGELAAGTCVRLFTGSALPRGADAVVMQEDTRISWDRSDEVLVLEPVRPRENVRFQGEDVKRGALLVETGEVLTPGRLALLAAVGLTHIFAGCRPVVGLLATGSELKEPGEPLAPGQIYESNRAGLAPLIECAGGIVKTFPLVSDEPRRTRAALERAFSECNLVLTCGGVSVGEMDFVKTAFEQLGGNLQFWKVAIKPGRPFVFGQSGDRFLFGLPGNPVSAFVTFLLLVRPAVLRWQGATEIALPASPGVLTGSLANPGPRRHFMRVAMDAAGNVHSTGEQASHFLSSLASANGLVEVAPQTTLETGTRVKVLRWE